MLNVNRVQKRSYVLLLVVSFLLRKIHLLTTAKYSQATYDIHTIGQARLPGDSLSPRISSLAECWVGAYFIDWFVDLALLFYEAATSMSSRIIKCDPLCRVLVQIYFAGSFFCKVFSNALSFRLLCLEDVAPTELK